MKSNRYNDWKENFVLWVGIGGGFIHNLYRFFFPVCTASFLNTVVSNISHSTYVFYNI